MRRPPIACQRAVQSLQAPAPQHTWVPDDVLSLAVHRFFRSTCPHQKRYGSNVPGPLEAKRRAAKRRMTASAGFFPQDSLPASFSLGALFAYRSEPQTSWRYEPPSLPKVAPPPDASLSSWVSARLGDLQPGSHANDQTSIDRDLLYPFAPPYTEKSLKDTRIQHIDTKAAIPSSSGLYASDDVLDHDVDYERCLADFRAKIAAAEDGHNGRLLKDAFRQHLPTGPVVWKYYVAVLEHTIKLGCDPVPLLQCLLQKDGHMLRPMEPVDGCASFLDCLESFLAARHANGRSLVHQIYQNVARWAAESGRSTTESHDDVLLRLIKHTGNAAFSRRSKGSALATNLPHALAGNLRESADHRLLLSYLAQSERAKGALISTVHGIAAVPDRSRSAERALLYVPQKQLLTLVPAITLHFANRIQGKRHSAEATKTSLMSIWFDLLQRIDNKANVGKIMLEAAMVPLAKALMSYNAPTMIPPAVLVNAMLLHQNLDIRATSATLKPQRFQVLFADVLRQIEAQSTAYSKLLDMSLLLVARHAGIGLLLRCIRTMEEHKLPLLTTMNFESLVAKEIEGLRSRTDNLSESQLQQRAFTLQACEKLLRVLSRMGHALPAITEEVADLVGVRQFDNLLSNARVNYSLPIAYRDVTKDIPLLERVAVVHQLAHHYSQDTTRTHREAWRSIYYLYNYLMSNSLPIGPLFTKAVVYSSITRPLSENRFVSARRLIWVCHLVARVEGDEVAARVENHFYKWRGDLIGRAKRIYVGVGGSKQGKAHVSTMKRLGLL